MKISLTRNETAITISVVMLAIAVRVLFYQQYKLRQDVNRITPFMQSLNEVGEDIHEDLRILLQRQEEFADKSGIEFDTPLPDDFEFGSGSSL